MLKGAIGTSYRHKRGRSRVKHLISNLSPKTLPTCLEDFQWTSIRWQQWRRSKSSGPRAGYDPIVMPILHDCWLNHSQNFKIVWYVSITPILFHMIPYDSTLFHMIHCCLNHSFFTQVSRTISCCRPPAAASAIPKGCGTFTRCRYFLEVLPSGKLT